jgi:hypothetical protein
MQTASHIVMQANLLADVGNAVYNSHKQQATSIIIQVSEQVACDLHSILLQNISNCNTVDFPA